MFNIEEFIKNNNVPNIEKVQVEYRKDINILFFQNPEEFNEFIEAIKPLKLRMNENALSGVMNEKHCLRMIKFEEDEIRTTKSSDKSYYKDCTIWSYQEFKRVFGLNKFTDLMI